MHENCFRNFARPRKKECRNSSVRSRQKNIEIDVVEWYRKTFGEAREKIKNFELSVFGGILGAVIGINRESREKSTGLFNLCSFNPRRLSSPFNFSPFCLPFFQNYYEPHIVKLYLRYMQRETGKIMYHWHILREKEEGGLLKRWRKTSKCRAGKGWNASVGFYLHSPDTSTIPFPVPVELFRAVGQTWDRFSFK